ncbi:unnamed protein product [Prorocentrum cordatum]|uniref:C3H1-type domain-containing protein n=1 Tax=Prorocentrum cordatum TaxID=2364126 RepID=A0ABN9QAU1_9DINO|nr:unnamed protein product [Polarella glacialis]
MWPASWEAAPLVEEAASSGLLFPGQLHAGVVLRPALQAEAREVLGARAPRFPLQPTASAEPPEVEAPGWLLPCPGSTVSMELTSSLVSPSALASAASRLARNSSVATFAPGSFLPASTALVIMANDSARIAIAAQPPLLVSGTSSLRHLRTKSCTWAESCAGSVSPEGEGGEIRKVPGCPGVPGGGFRALAASGGAPRRTLGGEPGALQTPNSRQPRGAGAWKSELLAPLRPAEFQIYQDLILDVAKGLAQQGPRSESYATNDHSDVDSGRVEYVEAWAMSCGDQSPTRQAELSLTALCTSIANPQDAYLAVDFSDTGGGACNGSSMYDYLDAQTEAGDGSDSWSQLGMPRVGSAAPPDDLATGQPLGSPVEQARENDQGQGVCSEVAKDHEDLSKVFREPPGLMRPEGLATRGSQAHGTGMCSPCAWIFKPQGCQRGVSCGYCHLCPEGELKHRRRLKAAAIRQGEPWQTEGPVPLPWEEDDRGPPGAAPDEGQRRDVGGRRAGARRPPGAEPGEGQRRDVGGRRAGAWRRTEKPGAAKRPGSRS